MYQRYLKRLFDVVIGIAAFPDCVGITVIVAPLIWSGRRRKRVLQGKKKRAQWQNICNV